MYIHILKSIDSPILCLVLSPNQRHTDRSRLNEPSSRAGANLRAASCGPEAYLHVGPAPKTSQSGGSAAHRQPGNVYRLVLRRRRRRRRNNGCHDDEHVQRGGGAGRRKFELPSLNAPRADNGHTCVSSNDSFGSDQSLGTPQQFMRRQACTFNP